MFKLRTLIGFNLVSCVYLLGFSSNAQAQWYTPPIPVNIPGYAIDNEICRQNLEVRNDPGCQNPGSLRRINQTGDTNVRNSTINHRAAIAYLEQGFQYYKNREYQRAIAAYNSAIANNPSYAAAYLCRSMALLKLGNKNDAYLDARRAAHWSRQQNNQKIYNAAQKMKHAIYR
ncbi:hypothetical protein [Calothrix sp. 336/3]|uniref:hypothetical protein n=1 Tax=Calothrix sp. 336/3 TaxID=1337936 RepID=UPI00069C9A24|nr:hypothetical protein [Calothrix sp. 336/3]